ncbi:MAG: hypothetical protein JO263_05355 [Candidatus Eremiobacteraeota bacterium]|nr:hypothetical protein [Candidatus Eremiobacteraeota bacterium]
MQLRAATRTPARITVALVMVVSAACSGSGGTSGILMPPGSGGGVSGGAQNTLVKIFVPAGAQPPVRSSPIVSATPPQVVGATSPLTGAPPITTPPPAFNAPASGGGQTLAINVSGPASINQAVPVGPNASGCSPVPGGTSCQLPLTLPAGTYVGTIGGTAVAFTVGATNNQIALTLATVAAQLAIVPASPMSVTNAQGGIDLYGGGRHPVVVEMLDANQNVIVGSAAGFSLSQAGGALPLTVTAAKTVAPNLFYVSGPAAASSSALLRATANSVSGTVRVQMHQVVAVANSNLNSVTLYVNGQGAPLASIQSSIANPQALIFDANADLFVANQLGNVTEYAPPFTSAPAAIANGVTHPQALALDSHGNLFVANGNGSNTVTVYAPPYSGPPSQVISYEVDDPVGLALDLNGDLFVLNSASNTVTEYAPPYTGSPTAISKGLNAPSSMALDTRGDLFVANLNSTPSSVVEYVPPYSSQSAPVATITNGINEQGSIALSPSATLFVPNQGANSVTEYTAPYTNAPMTITGGQNEPIALAVDAAGNLYVANHGNNTVTLYAPPYNGPSWTTFATGVGAPVALALSPPTSASAAVLP